MSRPKVTIATAVFDDHAGTYMLVQSLRMFHDMEDVEILVLDNNPSSPNGKETKALIDSIKNHCDASYYEHVGPGGTSQTRNQLFDLAKGELVVVCDCHIMLRPDAIKNLKAWWATTTEEEKTWLYTGSLLYDNLATVSTHFECDEFRSQMLGTWATAWVDPQGNYLVGRNFENELRMKPLMSEGPWMRSGIQWPGHEKALRAKGFKIAGEDGKPYEVPGQGFGMFISSKEHWLPFHKDYREFGGEECVHNDRLRKLGRKTVNLPFMDWLHRFGRPDGPRYPISNEGKLRNYILGFTGLGLDLEPVRKHFVDETGVKQELFDLIVSDPVNFDPKNNKFYKQHPNTNLQNMQPVSKSNFGMDLPLVADNLHTIAMHMAGIPRDLDKHAQTLMQLASQCSSVAEITHRRESTAFLLAGLTRKQACGKDECQKTKKCENTCKGPVRMVSWQSERDTLIPMLLEAVKTSPGKPVTYTDHKIGPEDGLPENTDDFDMLFLDTSTGAMLAQQLERYAPKIKKFIAIHDTQVYGMKDIKGEVGHIHQIKTFLKANPSWFLMFHTDEQYGLSVLSCDPEYKPAEPLAPWPKTTKDGEGCGAGTFLKKFFESIGQYSSETCTCRAKQRAMDANGTQWCRDNMEFVLDGIKEEYDKRVAMRQAALEKYKTDNKVVVPPMMLPWSRIGMKLVVYRCIRQAEKQIACGECA